MAIIIWEWSDSGRWFPYKPKVSNFIEKLYQANKLGHSSNSHFVKLGTVDWDMSVYEVDVSTLKQRRISTGMLREIRRTEKPKNGSHNLGVTWEWNEGRHWTPYDPFSIKIIEQKYREKTTSRFSLSNRYSVELQPHPIQINNQTGFRRPIRRQTDEYVENSDNRSQAKGNAIENGHSNDTMSVEGMNNSSSKSFSPSKFDPKAGKSELSNSPESSKIAKAENSSTPSSTSTADQNLFLSRMPSHIKFDYCLKPFKKSEEEDETKTKEMCAICQSDFDVFFDDYLEKGETDELPEEMSVTMPCGHPFHLECASDIYKNNQEKFLSCPLCKKIYAGTLTGTQPVGGSMEVRLISEACVGYEGYKTHQIVYQIPQGIQGPEHPNPGQPYHASGFPRIAFIPATDEGNLIVKMLRVAFDRRLIFTVGTSHTTGLADAVVWSSVHHKTSLSGSAHSYPDPNHLSVLKQELNDVNVFESDVQ